MGQQRLSVTSIESRIAGNINLEEIIIKAFAEMKARKFAFK
jgi:hypothetical protein